MKEEILTPKEVGRILGRHPDTIRRWLRKGILAGSCASGTWIVLPEAVERFKAPARVDALREESAA